MSRIDWPKVIGWGAILVGSLVFWALVARGVAQDKPPADPWCAPSSEGWCNPTDPAIVAPYPPDMPPVVKLRAQLAKERAAWRVERRALRAEIADLMDERSGR